MAEEPELWIGGVKVTEANASNILNDGKVSFDFATNTLTFTANPTFSGVHNGALIDSDMETLTIVVPSAGLTISHNTATKIINMSAGALTVNGNLNLTMSSDDAEACIYAEKGITVNGNVDTDMYGIDEGCGILSPDGPVSISGYFFGAGEIGIFCAGGNVTVGGIAAFINGSWSESSYGIHVTNGYGVDVGGLEQTGTMQYAIHADGDVLVRGAVNIENGMPIGGEGIRSVNGKVECQGVVNMKGKTNKLDVFIYAGGSEGILLGGNATLETGRAALVSPLTAPNGPIRVNGDLSIKAGGMTQVLAKDDITVNGNATLQNNRSSTTTQPYDGKAISSTEGSILVTGDLKTVSSESGIYAYNDIRIDGSAAATISIQYVRDYVLKAENGAVSIGGNLTTSGAAKDVVYGKTGITVNGDIAINAAYKDGMDPAGCYAMHAPEGSVTAGGTVSITATPQYGYEGDVTGAEIGVYAGDQISIAKKWDVTAATAALRAVNGIVKPGNFGVTTPEHGVITALADGTTVTEADRTTVAAHAVIEEVETVTITMDPCNGDEATAITIPAGGTIEELPAGLQREWYKFIGWFMDSRTGLETGTGEQVTTETVFNEDTTIYGNWYMPGDVNGDGKVNNKDVNLLMNYVGGEDVTVVQYACDVTGDGKINNKDVNLLMNYVAGEDVEIN